LNLIKNNWEAKMKKKSLYLFFIVLLSTCIILIYNEKFHTKDSLRKVADKNNIKIGTAVNAYGFFKDKKYRNLIKEEFNAITLESELKFVSVHPQRERYDFLIPDIMIDFALKNKIKVRGHTLVWHDSLPDWILNNQFSKEELEGILKNHIQTVVGHYKGKIYAWDVVNEAFNEDGTLRDNVWLKGIGPEYMELAFRWAHEADPDALLFYNDFHNDVLNAKSDAIYITLKDFKEKGVPINGVGFQSHISINEKRPYEDISKNMERLSDIGLQVHITEMDVSIRENDNPIVKRLEKQAKIYGDTLSVCLKHNNCSSFVVWGATDKYSWIPLFTGKEDQPLLFDNDYKPKYSYDALYKILTHNK
jgi:endo-1,4-beta-xylanase